MRLRRAKLHRLTSAHSAVLVALVTACSGTVTPAESEPNSPSEVRGSSPDGDQEDLPADSDPEGAQEEPSSPGSSPTPPDSRGASDDASGPEETPSNPSPNEGEPVVPAPDALSAPDRTIVDRCGDEVHRGAANSGVRKLSKTGLLNALRSALASHDYYELSMLREFQDFTYITFDKRDPMQIAFNQYPQDFSFKAGEDFQQTYSRDQLAAWLQVVDVVGAAFASKGFAKEYVDSECFSEDATLECRKQLAENFGKRAFRRPLSPEEVDAFSFPDAEGSTPEVVAAIVSRLLLAPQFMYQLEVSSTPAQDGRVRVSAYDVASRLAFALTDAPPDEELLDAAASGELDELEGVRSQAARLLQTEDGRKALEVFFSNWLQLESISNPAKSWGNFKRVPTSIENLYNSEKLADLYRDEAKRYLRYVVWELGGTFQDLMTLPIAFPTDGDGKLQSIYQTETNGSGEPVSAPLHPGLLTRPALLASRGQSPSPIHRGLGVLTRILCNPVPSPDFTVVATRAERLNSFDPHALPNFEITTQMTEEPACSSCHQVINPVGFIFEAYNPLGQRDTVQRVIENIYSFEKFDLPFPQTDEGVEYAEMTQFPLPGAQKVFIEAGLQSEFTNPDEFVAAVAESGSARACLAVRYFRHVNRRSEAPDDACSVAETAGTLATNSLTDAFIDAVANEDIFWRKP